MRRSRYDRYGLGPVHGTRASVLAPCATITNGEDGRSERRMRRTILYGSTEAPFGRPGGETAARVSWRRRLRDFFMRSLFSRNRERRTRGVGSARRCRELPRAYLSRKHGYSQRYGNRPCFTPVAAANIIHARCVRVFDPTIVGFTKTCLVATPHGCDLVSVSVVVGASCVFK